MSPSIFTIGNSNHPLDRFLALLAQHEVEALGDIRRFPGSRKPPTSAGTTMPPPCRSGAAVHGQDVAFSPNSVVFSCTGDC
jgi:hypothetical protein